MDNEMKERAVNMANTIWQTLFWSITPAVVLSWGVSKRTATYYNQMPALEFRVNGMVHKGSVIICYEEGHDVFIAYLLDKKRNVVKTMDGLFCDELGKRIDEAIERPANVTDTQYRSKTISELVNAI